MDVKEKNVYMRVYVCHIHTDTYIQTDRQERSEVTGERMVFLLMVLEKLVSYLKNIYVAPVHIYICDIYATYII